jgi:hypothetical protein
MAAGAPIAFQGFYKRMGLAQFKFDTDTIACALYTSTLIPDAGTQEVLADLTGEVGAVNGYTAGGVALTTLTWTENGTTGMILNAANTVFTASGGSITARYYLLYNATPVAKPLIAYGLLDTTNVDVTVSAGNSFIFNWEDTNGIVRFP